MFNDRQLLKGILELFALVLRFIYQLLIYISSIKQNKVFFMAYHGKGYVCNPKYITEYILKTNSKSKLEIIWLCSNKDDCNYLNSLGIKTISNLYSFQTLKALLTSKIIIDNYLPVHYYTRRNEQIYIQTWHGGGCYKTNGITVDYINPLTKKAILYAANQISYFISSCKIFSEEAIRKGFGYTGEVLEIGMPRNDILINNNSIEIIKKKVRQEYHIPEHASIILYAPTFRDKKNNCMFDDLKLNINELLKSCNKKWGGTWVLLVRGHCCQDLKSINNAIDASFYPDIQELLLVSDVLISDYSSTIWDFSFTYKPCFLFCPDIDNYRNNRNFHRDIFSWRFPIAKNNIELFELIKNFSQSDFYNNMVLHHNEYGSFEKGNACSIVSNIVVRNIN